MVLGGTLMGIGVALLIKSSLGIMPWDVWHVGLSRVTGLTVGQAVIVTNIAILLIWLPFRIKPGIGTIANLIIPGVTCDIALNYLPNINSLMWRITILVVGTIVFSCGSALYLGVRWGPGPRDGLMLAFTRRGYDLRIVRTLIEFAALIAGALLLGPLSAIQDGMIGIGTIALVLAVGQILHYLLPRVTWRALHS